MLVGTVVTNSSGGGIMLLVVHSAVRPSLNTWPDISTLNE